VRPDATSLALFVHILGAMLLVGGLLTGGSALAFGWRDASARFLGFGYRALLVAALPGWVLMRIGAQWTESKENLPEDFDPTWLGIGYLTADLGGIVFLVTLILGGIGVRKLRDGGGGGLLKASTVLSLVLLAAYVVTVWAMAGKPD
jgi:hypothetical protein